MTDKRETAEIVRLKTENAGLRAEFNAEVKILAKEVARLRDIIDEKAKAKLCSCGRPMENDDC